MFLKHRFAILQSTQFSCLCSTVWIYELYLACATFWFKTCLLHCICLSPFFHSCLSFVREYIRKRKRVRVGCGLWSYLREIQQELEADRCSCGITTGDKALAGWPGVVPGGQLGYLIVLVHAFTIQNDNRFFWDWKTGTEATHCKFFFSFLVLGKTKGIVVHIHPFLFWVTAACGAFYRRAFAFQMTIVQISKQPKFSIIMTSLIPSWQLSSQITASFNLCLFSLCMINATSDFRVSALLGITQPHSLWFGLKTTSV